MSEILRVENLRTEFSSDYGIVSAVNDVSFHINSGEIVGFVGESGCGKSTTMMSMLQLIVNSPERRISGHVWFEGQDLMTFKHDSPQMCAVRGGKISMIFQEPMTSLNPTMKIGEQIAEMLRLHKGMNKDDAWNKAIQLLEMVGIPNAKARANDYPHRFSGGMRQRVMIAIAASCSPKLIIADEFTTALDVTTQAQVLEVLRKMTAESDTAIAIVTHNLGLIARYADRINVMYAGKIIESGSTKQLFGKPLHPYTRGLLAAVPRLDRGKTENRLSPIPGLPPNLAELPDYCAFYPRCPYSTSACMGGIPELTDVEPGHCAACIQAGRI